MKKYLKGEYEFASYKKKVEIIKTLVMFAVSVGLYLMGYFTTGSNKNLLTIVAVLGMLPASKLAVNAIMNCRIKPVSVQTKDAIDSHVGSLYGLYNILFTSYEKNYAFAHIVITGDSVVGLTFDPKFDEKKFTEHLTKHMKLDGITGIVIKVFDKEESYLRRLDELNSRDEQNNSPSEKLVNLLVNISL